MPKRKAFKKPFFQLIMYAAREDSLLLLKEVNKYAKGKVLDMGAGSAVQALGAADRKDVDSILAVDIDKEVVKELKKTIKTKKIRIGYSNLFSNVKGKFDTIIFNPPYLPDDAGMEDRALYGGKEGHELIEKFFKQVSRHLNREGIILLVFSSFTGKKKVDSIIAENGFKSRQLGHQRIFFEELWVYIAEK